MITETQREALIDAVTAADLTCPEQVCDMVLAVAERDGYEAGLAAIETARRNDEAEAKSLGIASE